MAPIVLFLPGLNSSGFPTDIPPEFRTRKLAPKLKKLCDANSWGYITTSFKPVPTNIENAVTRLQELQNRLASNTPYVIVTSSFGAWVALKSVLFLWPSNLKGLILVSPFFTVQGIAQKVGPVGRWWARTFGFKRQDEEGIEAFHIPPAMVISMLDEKNDLLDGRLTSLRGHPISVLVHGSSRYKPNRYNKQLKQETDGTIKGRETEEEMTDLLECDLKRMFAL